MIKLRPYQIEARDAVLEQWQAGRLNVLVAAAVGSGKTEMGLATLALDPTMRRYLWISHRRELILQPRDRILEHWIDQLGRPGIVMADHDEYQAKGIIATIQTLSANGRLDRILSAGKITHLVIDETHHSTARTYVDLYKRLRKANPDLRHLGLTATPKRTDGEGLTKIYDVVAYRAGVKDMIKIGALCPFIAMSVQLPVSLANVRESGDGWAADELGEVLKVDNAEEIVVETWEKHAKDRPTLAFTASVAQAYSLAKKFRDRGFAFEAIDATTKKDRRDNLVRQFKAGDVQGLVNVGIFTEGTDLPLASCLLQIRPTRSDLVFMQMCGRVLRRYPGKKHALILDFVPEDARDMRLAGDLLGKPKEQRKAEQKAESQGIILGCFGINSDGTGIDGNPDEVVMKVLNYLSASRLSWTFDGDLASATAGERTTMAIVLPDPTCVRRLEKANDLRAAGEWKDSWGNEYEKVKKWAGYSLRLVQGYGASTLGWFDTWEAACDAAEDYVDDKGLDILSKKASSWRRKPASDKQRDLCLKFKIWKLGMSRGEAAQRLTHYFARQALRM